MAWVLALPRKFLVIGIRPCCFGDMATWTICHFLRRNKHGGSLSVRQPLNLIQHGPSMTIASQEQARIEIKSQSSGFFRLEADIAEIPPTRSSRCIEVIPKIYCHEFEQQSQTAQCKVSTGLGECQGSQTGPAVAVRFSRPCCSVSAGHRLALG